MEAEWNWASQRNESLHCVQKKKLHELYVDLDKNCSEYTQGKVDSDNVEIRYSLRPMT